MRVVNMEPVVNAPSLTPKGECDEGVSMPKGGLQAMIDAIEGKSRQVEWQQANRDRYNEKMREHMKERRRLKKAGFIGIAYG